MPGWLTTYIYYIPWLFFRTHLQHQKLCIDNSEGDYSPQLEGTGPEGFLNDISSAGESASRAVPAWHTAYVSAAVFCSQGKPKRRRALRLLHRLPLSDWICDKKNSTYRLQRSRPLLSCSCLSEVPHSARLLSCYQLGSPVLSRRRTRRLLHRLLHQGLVG